MTRKYLLTICLAILLPAALPAAGTLRFSNFHDQTAMFSVRSIAQQEDGMIWFGTERNLYSFDGYDLLPHPCPDGHIQVNKLLFWGDGLLLGTNGGLYSFLPAASSFRRARPFDGALVRDLQSIGNFVYVATDSGLYRYDPRTETAGRIADGDFITLSAYGQDLYAGKYDGIGIYRTGSGLYAPWFPDLHLHLATRFLDDGDAIWVGTPTQLLHIDKAAGRILAAVPLPVVKSLCRDLRRAVPAPPGRFGHRPVHPGGRAHHRRRSAHHPGTSGSDLGDDPRPAHLPGRPGLRRGPAARTHPGRPRLHVRG